MSMMTPYLKRSYAPQQQLANNRERLRAQLLAQIARKTKLPARGRKYLKAKTSTRTAVKKIQNKYVRADNQGNSWTMYKRTLGSFTSWQKNLIKNTPDNVYYSNYGQNTTCAPGVQVFDSIGTNVLDATMVAAIFNTLASVSENSKILLRSSHTSHLLRNQGNNGIHCRIYDVVARRDTEISPVTAISNGFAEAGGLSGKSVYVGAELTSSKEFCQLYEIKSCKQFFLGAGQTHRHTRITNYNKLLSNQMTENSTVYRGISNFCIIQYYGNIVADTADVDVSTGTAVIDIVTVNKLRYTYVAPVTQPTLSYVNSLSATIGGQGFINPEDENVETGFVNAG